MSAEEPESTEDESASQDDNSLASDEVLGHTPSDPSFADSVALFERYREQNDQEALGELFRRYRSRLSRKVSILMSHRVRQHLDASDVAQSVLIRGMQHIDRFQFEDPSALMRWLTTIALNLIRNRGRQLGRRGEEVFDPMTELSLVDLDGPELRVEHPLESIEREERKRITDQAITCLSEEHRTVILHHWFDNEGSWAVVGERMGRSANAAQKLHRRALDELRVELARRGIA